MSESLLYRDIHYGTTYESILGYSYFIQTLYNLYISYQPAKNVIRTEI